MAANKSQHYVPQFYLKHFAIDDGKKFLKLFLTKPQKIIERASLRDQCAKSYFYGRDLVVEKTLAQLKGTFSKCFDKLKGSPQNVNEESLFFIRAFAVLQHLRTDGAAKRSQSGIDQMLEGIKPEDAPEINAQRTSVESYPEMLEHVSDLRVKIIRNQTKIDFISSDDPSVHLNKFLPQKFKHRHGSTAGITSAGVFFWLPITPRLGAVIYDSDIYKIEPNQASFLELRSVSDVVRLNEFQLINAQNCAFLSVSSTIDGVKGSFENVTRVRAQERVRVHHAIEDREKSSDDTGHKFYTVVSKEELDKIVSENDVTKTLVHVEHRLPFPERWPSFFRYRLKPKFIDTGTGAGVKRVSAGELRL